MLSIYDIKTSKSAVTCAYLAIEQTDWDLSHQEATRTRAIGICQYATYI